MEGRETTARSSKHRVVREGCIVKCARVSLKSMLVSCFLHYSIIKKNDSASSELDHWRCPQEVTKIYDGGAEIYESSGQGLQCCGQGLPPSATSLKPPSARTPIHRPLGASPTISEVVSWLEHNLTWHAEEEREHSVATSMHPKSWNFFHSLSITSIFGSMHEVVNIGKKITNYTV
jgi:hypothetical protein